MKKYGHSKLIHLPSGMVRIHTKGFKDITMHPTGNTGVGFFTVLRARERLIKKRR